MILTRRRLLTGLIAAPIVVRAGLLMPVKAITEPKMALLGVYWGVQLWGPENLTLQLTVRDSLRPGLVDCWATDATEWSAVFA